ncbi:ABC transporter ATP-binding protein [Dactylosporangium sp. AC04546]|uniref:ABC transporter ATP-binding protein n=1 Tax=Dactylosporangium sp. AC04546 TaxID=2862460 RepID=UPI002E7B0B9A|nr:ABC transporter ATP-binding protein [Dactylosporangium sp. AC04546]WVK88954.1 ABC transporter ATP-binding protein [Dactylosporangium sp. AC04546]
MHLDGEGVLRRSMLAHRGRIVASAALFTGHQAGEALVPILIGVVIDRAVATGRPGSLLLWLGVLAATFVMLSLSWRFGTRVGTVAGAQADRSLRIAVTAAAVDRTGDGPLPGALVSIATGDARRTAMVNFQAPHGVAAVVGVAVASIALLVVSVPLGLLILLGTPPLLYLVRLLSGPLERRSADQQERAAQAAGVAADLVRGVRVIKGIGAERTAAARYRAISRASLVATLHTARAEAGYNGAVIVVNGLFLALVALVGGRLAAAGDITVGQLVSAVGLAQFLLGPLGAFGEIIAAVAGGRASAARIATATTAGAPSPAAADPPAGAGRLRLRGLTGPGLDRIDLDVAAGELVGVVAEPVAAGTLLRLLGREAEPTAGAITVDGVDAGDVGRQAWRATVLASPHDADLFEGSVEANIRAGRTGDIGPAVTAAGVDQVAAALPDGLGTAVTARGRSLSGGQRQRVALARALHADPPVLVLHDPTTAVDAVTEAAIAAGLRDVRAGRTTVVLTSSPALLAAADRVVFLTGGAVAAHGTHAHLLRTEPAYRTLVLA